MFEMGFRDHREAQEVGRFSGDRPLLRRGGPRPSLALARRDLLVVGGGDRVRSGALARRIVCRVARGPAGGARSRLGRGRCRRRGVDDRDAGARALTPRLADISRGPGLGDRARRGVEGPLFFGARRALGRQPFAAPRRDPRVDRDAHRLALADLAARVDRRRRRDDRRRPRARRPRQRPSDRVAGRP